MVMSKRKGNVKEQEEVNEMYDSRRILIIIT